MGELTARQTSWRELFRNESPFVIPIYQRPYAWEEGDVEDFCIDLREARDELILKPESENRPFFGSIVTKRVSGTTGEAHDILSIIDGQQRLTSFYMTMHLVAREYQTIHLEAVEEGDEMVAAAALRQANIIEEQHLWYYFINLEDERKIRTLKLTEQDDPFFNELLEDPEKFRTRKSKLFERVSHQRIRDSYFSIKTGLVQMGTAGDGATEEYLSGTVAEKYRTLKALDDLLASKVCFVHIRADNQAQEHALFRSLNDRGLDLSEIDLLRNQTLSCLVGTSHSSHASSVWDGILKTDRTGAYSKKFLKAYSVVHTGIAPTDKKLLRWFGDNWIVSKDQREIVSFIEDLELHAVNYAKISDGRTPFENKHGGWELDRLERLVDYCRHSAAHPLVLAAAVKLDEKECMDLVHQIAKFAFRYKLICEGAIQGPSKVYYKAANDIYNGRFDKEEFLKDLQDFIDSRADDERFSSDLKDKLSYSSGSNRLIKYFLATLEEYETSFLNNENPLRPDKVTTHNIRVFDIEHILPAAPGPNVPGEMSSRKDNIENLTLWAYEDNRAAQDADFEVKREGVDVENGKPEKWRGYCHSRILLTSGLTKYEEWTVESMDNRLEGLLERACQIFRLA